MVEGVPLPSRIGRLRLPTLCLVTDRHQCSETELEAVVAAAIEGGVNVVQLREKDLPAGELFSLGMRLREVTRGKALLLINDRVDVAQACGADGVHLPENGLPTPIARWVMGRNALVGRSVHTAEAAAQAERDGADLVHLGTIFVSPSKPDSPPVGPALLREVVDAVSVPVLAVGGVTPENAGEAIAAGASGVAVISAICGADDPKAAAKALVEAMTEAWRRRETERKAEA
jgi:thiamine-phosphate pyrophosphorylase